ncbi:hypothetical protein IF2G_07795 [Cordyceps javanica]|nr:hypothetical protein IF2G_07795 [Cordyceps javanica]
MTLQVRLLKSSYHRCREAAHTTPPHTSTLDGSPLEQLLRVIFQDMTSEAGDCPIMAGVRSTNVAGYCNIIWGFL